MPAHKKSQIATTDLVISVIILIVFLVLIVAAFMYGSKKVGAEYIYGGVVFNNLEKLETGHFLNNYKIDETELGLFGGLAPEVIRNSLLKDTEFIPSTSEICVFFRDTGAPVYEHGTSVQCQDTRPCTDDQSTYIFAKPVLKEITPSDKKIQNLLIVVCQ